MIAYYKMGAILACYLNDFSSKLLNCPERAMVRLRVVSEGGGGRRVRGGSIVG